MTSAATHAPGEVAVAAYQPVLDFWFREIAPAQWWKKDPAFDASIAQRFAGVHAQAVRGECHAWRAAPHGRLAEVIVLDQFSRNLFREDARAFAADGMALVLAQEAVACRADAALLPDERTFLYMPYMHSESLSIHRIGVPLFAANGLPRNLDFALRHQAVIERFGRYPHRNAALGRPSMPEETAFLAQPGSSF